jgi:hypothetical protein
MGFKNGFQINITKGGLSITGFKTKKQIFIRRVQSVFQKSF